MADPVSAGVIYAAIGTSAAVTLHGQNVQRKATKKSAELSSAQGKIEDQARIRQQAREKRRRQAQIMQASENLGSVGSSREVGGISNLQQQASANLARMSGQQKTIEGLSEANKDLATGQTISAIGQVGMNISSMLTPTPKN